MLQVVIDNCAPLPPRLRDLLGIEHFGEIRYKRRTLELITRDAIQEAGLPLPILLSEPADWVQLSQSVQLDDPDRRYLVCTAGVVASRGPEMLTGFLRQARYSPQNLVLPALGGAESSGWALMNGTMFRRYLASQARDQVALFFEQNRNQFVLMEERLALVDLRDEITLLEFLSGTLDARFFNAIERDAYTIKKTSTDRAKLKREYDFYALLPARMQMFFVRPFDFEDDGRSASYRMERLFVPDVAVQWLHGALTPPEFGRFLDHVMHFVETRARRAVVGDEASRAIQSLFVNKVRERVAAMKTTAAYPALKPLIDGACGGLDALLDRYLALFERWRSRLPSAEMVIGHGDLCFSNILYAKSTQTMKLIDARGASNEADLWTHPYYDLAKLSHSIVGNYDFVNQDRFEIHIDEAVRPRLVIDRPPVDWPRALFEERLTRAGFDLRLVRLCEASLFVSMLPLHIDRPRKVLGFVLVAIDILDSLETDT